MVWTANDGVVLVFGDRLQLICQKNCTHQLSGSASLPEGDGADV
jgi:hypothetical protein